MPMVVAAGLLLQVEREVRLVDQRTEARLMAPTAIVGATPSPDVGLVAPGRDLAVEAAGLAERAMSRRMRAQVARSRAAPEEHRTHGEGRACGGVPRHQGAPRMDL
jgi:hypothetical protein